ncbi:MAG: hypothetical protein K9G28_09490, partial [Candidatus Nanopelagicales bacterium]|nr:hypothetical protein [Candidatus Nanopelagicales bacterium]
SARLNPAALVHSAASTRPFAYWVALPIVALALPVLLRIWPLESAVVILLVTAGWTLAVSVVANVVAPRMSPPKAVLAYASWIGLIALGSALAVQAVVDATGSYRPDGGNIPLLAALSYGVVYPLGGLVAGIGVARRQVLLGLRASISDEEVRRAALRHEEGEVRREIATTLHGSWSGNLTAVSMRLQQAIDDGDRQAAQEALHEARRIVDIDVAREIHRETADAHGVVHALVSSWEGLVVINADVDPDLDVSRGMLRAIEDVVTEGINNAVRHADAERVDVSIAACAGSVCVVIADDGAAPAAAPRRGMGSRLLDARAPSAWWREARAGGGSVLTVLLKPTDEVT